MFLLFRSGDNKIIELLQNAQRTHPWSWAIQYHWIQMHWLSRCNLFPTRLMLTLNLNKLDWHCISKTFSAHYYYFEFTCSGTSYVVSKRSHNHISQMLKCKANCVLINILCYTHFSLFIWASLITLESDLRVSAEFTENTTEIRSNIALFMIE